MELKQLVMLALQVSILATVFGFGLKATTADLLYLIRRPGLLLRSLVAVFVIMPALAVVLALVFDFPRPAEIVLISVAMSPVPPLLPQKETKAGGHASYGLGLMAILSLASIVIVPVAVAILGYFFERPLAMAPGAVAKLVMSAALAPLAAGMAVRAMAPAMAKRLEPVVARIAKVLLPVALVVLLTGTFSAMLGAGRAGNHPGDRDLHRRRTRDRPPSRRTRSRPRRRTGALNRVPASGDRSGRRVDELSE